MPIPVRKIKTFPDIFNYVTYKDTAEALGMNATTLKNYVEKTPGKFRLGHIDKLAEFLECDRWRVLELAHDWVVERGS